MINLIMNNLALFIPMALAGLFAVSEIKCRSRIVRTSLRAVAAVFGLLAALLVVEMLPILI